MVVMNRMKRVPDMNVDIRQIKIILIECIVEIDIDCYIRRVPRINFIYSTKLKYLAMV